MAAAFRCHAGKTTFSTFINLLRIFGLVTGAEVAAGIFPPQNLRRG
jgi:hypothetical protein